MLLPSLLLVLVGQESDRCFDVPAGVVELPASVDAALAGADRRSAQRDAGDAECVVGFVSLSKERAHSGEQTRRVGREKGAGTTDAPALAAGASARRERQAVRPTTRSGEYTSVGRST
jgi:phage tail tape-measure protein